MTPIEFRPAAEREVRSARRFYRRKGGTALARFSLDLDAAVARVVAAPTACPAYLLNTRFCPLKKFPYYLVFRVEPTRVLVIAVAHNRRRPGYWVRRLPRP